MRRLTWSVFVATLVLFVVAMTSPAAAQLQGPPEISIVAPAASSTRHALNPKIRVEWSIGGQCLDDGNGGCDPDTGTLDIKVNGLSKKRSFTIDGGGQYAQNGTGNAGNVNLTNGQWNSVYATICNSYDCAEQTISVYIQAGAQQVIDIAPLHPSVYSPDACAAVGVAPGAAFACDALVLTHGIPGYVSLGALRSVALVYSSRSALAQVTVPANVQLIWDAAATKVEAWLNHVSDSTYWDGTDWDGTSGTVNRRIVLSRPEQTDSGGYVGRAIDTLVVRVHTAAGTSDSVEVDTLPFYFERDGYTTPIARGWSISGLSRIYGSAGHNPNTSAPNADVLVVGSGGAIAYFKYVSVQSGTRSYARPDGVLATLTKTDASSTWTLVGIDGTRQYYTWVYALGYARLDSVTTPAGMTRIAYRSGTSGDPDTIIDPVGQKIRFAYANSGPGSLRSICAPAGANERCTTISYGMYSGHYRVLAITDPDSSADSLSYSGTPHWSTVTSYKPRGRGWYTIAYHTTVQRPFGVVQPNSSDTVTYLAPQLAGAAIVGGTSGSPATPADADSAWGWVRPPLGPTSYFTADRYGLSVLSKGPDNTVSRVARNAGGQPVWTWAAGSYLAYWTYNSMGAVSTTHMAGGDTTTVTYSSPCSSGTGYPCLPAQAVVKRSPLPPDTTTWYYGGDELVDSVYQSDGPALANSGMTHLWYGTHANVESVEDPQGHRQSFAYEGTWGNLSEVRTDSILGKCPGGCQQTIDTTTYTYDVTGRVQSTHQGGTGRSATVFRDRVARDTMVIDTAYGGGSAITTKTRFNDAARTVTVIDGNGQSLVSTYDVRGRLLTQTDPASAKDSVAYDGNDRVASWTTRRNQTIAYGYDALGRVNLKVAAGDTTTYGYHETYGTLDTIVNPDAAIYRVHNSKGWLTQEKTIVNGVTRIVSYGYDANGVLDTLTDPWSQVYSFGWDGTNRARTVTNPYSETYSIRHSSEGMVSSVYFPTGHDAFNYDASHLIKSAGLSGEVTYTRDTVTKGFASIKLGGMTQTFGYDGFGRLASEAHDSATGTYGPASESYSYDAAGNRTGTGYSYTAANAVRGRPSIGGDSFAPGDSLVYDAAGNPTWWKNKSTNGYDSLTWDPENRLTRLRRYTSGGTLQIDATYKYDGLGRRVSVTGTGVSDRLYVWDGWNLLAETGTNGSAGRRYTYAPEGVDFPLAVRQNSASYYLHQDGLGNVYAMTDTSGTKVTEYRYRAYGDRYVTPVGESQQSMLTYKGREEDRATGLVYMRNRYYSPRLERFLNEDPIGISGGLNTFTFVGGNPVNGADPFGLCGGPRPDEPCPAGTLPEIVVTDRYWWLRNWITRPPLSDWLLPLGSYAVSLGMGPNGFSVDGSGASGRFKGGKSWKQLVQPQGPPLEKTGFDILRQQNEASCIDEATNVVALAVVDAVVAYSFATGLGVVGEALLAGQLGAESVTLGTATVAASFAGAVYPTVNPMLAPTTLIPFTVGAVTDLINCARER